MTKQPKLKLEKAWAVYWGGILEADFFVENPRSKSSCAYTVFPKKEEARRWISSWRDIKGYRIVPVLITPIKPNKNVNS